jgi:condensation domain-containing protein
LNKHTILRTSLIFDDDDGTLKQCITDKHQIFTLVNEQTFTNEKELQDIISQTTIDPNLFDLSIGRVFHCQILRQQKLLNGNNDNQLITSADVLVIAFHHAAFDRSCRPIFLTDLCSSYNKNLIWSEDEESLQYIDYSTHERLMNMTSSREFWHSQLIGYNAKHSLALPVDQQRSFADQRSGFAAVIQISLNDKISRTFLDYASSHQVTLFQLGLATFYAFLFKLTHGQTDLYISCLNANRYRTELQNMFGMIVATLPYRIQLNPHWSFDELVKHVQEKCLSILEHSHYPLQHILFDLDLNQPNIPFLNTVFDFVTVSSNIDQLSFDGAALKQMSLRETIDIAKFDFMLTVAYNPTSNDNKLSFQLACSRDLFTETTVAKIAGRFQFLLEQLLQPTFNTVSINDSNMPISKFSLMLPEEAEELQGVTIHRLENIVNNGM